MNPFKWIAGGSEMANKSLDAIIKGGDALILTDEERLAYNQKAGELWLDIQKTLNEETSIRSVTRRVMAAMIMGSFTSIVLSGCIVWPFWPEYSAFLIGVADDKFGMMAIGVAAFYFGVHVLRSKK